MAKILPPSSPYDSIWTGSEKTPAVQTTTTTTATSTSSPRQSKPALLFPQDDQPTTKSAQNKFKKQQRSSEPNVSQIHQQQRRSRDRVDIDTVAPDCDINNVNTARRIQRHQQQQQDTESATVPKSAASACGETANSNVSGPTVSSLAPLTSFIKSAAAKAVKNPDSEIENVSSPVAASLIVVMAIVFLIMSLLIPFLRGQSNINLLQQFWNPDGASMVQLMAAPCPNSWMDESAPSLQCYWLTNGNTPNPHVNSKGGNSNHMDLSGNNVGIFTTTKANTGTSSLYVYHNASRTMLPVWTIVGVRSAVLDAAYQQRKIKYFERIPAPIDPCPEDPQCAQGIQESCCRSNIGLAPLTAAHRRAGIDVQTMCLDPRTSCYPCEKDHFPVISGYIMVGTQNMTVFICASPKSSASSTPIVPQMASKGVNNDAPVTTQLPGGGDFNDKNTPDTTAPSRPAVAPSYCEFHLSGPNCQYKVGTCLSAKSMVPCQCDGYNTTCPICSNAVGPACGDVRMSRNVRRMSLCGADATHSMVTYDKNTCECKCCVKIENEGIYCGGSVVAAM